MSVAQNESSLFQVGEFLATIDISLFKVVFMDTVITCKSTVVVCCA